MKKIINDPNNVVRPARWVGRRGVGATVFVENLASAAAEAIAAAIENADDGDGGRFSSILVRRFWPLR